MWKGVGASNAHVVQGSIVIFYYTDSLNPYPIYQGCRMYEFSNLFQSVQGIIKLPPSFQCEEPNLLPFAHQQVDPGILGFDLCL